MRSTAGRLVAAVVVAAMVVVAAACSDPTPKSTSHPLTSDQAAVLADALYLNWQDKGATFTANASFTTSRSSIAMQGEVDWTTGTGHALVRSAGSATGLTEVWWNPTVVIEYWPAIADLLPSLGYPNAKFVSRAPDPERRLVDRAIAVINALAAPERENPVLIQQKEGSEFVRSDDVRGSNVDVLRYGPRNMYWISTDTARMLRFDGNAESGAAPVIVDLLQTGTRTITPPPIGAIVPSDTIGSLYRSLTSS